MSINRGEITQYLHDASTGDSVAVAQLWSEVQADVHDMAINICRNEVSGITIQPTMLVNEVWGGSDAQLVAFEEEFVEILHQSNNVTLLAQFGFFDEVGRRSCKRSSQDDQTIILKTVSLLLS